MGKYEKRFTPQEHAEIRVEHREDKPTRIMGYFAKFGKLSRNLGGFVERIEKGFFRSALENSDVVDLFNHDSNYPLGRESASGEEGKLRVWEDDVGLRYELTPLQTHTVKDMVITPIEKGVIRGNSFGFMVREDGEDWEKGDDGVAIRTLKQDGCDEIIDGSQVLFPAYPDTTVAVRSLEEWRDSETAAEKEEREKQLKVETDKKEKLDKDKKERENDINNKKAKLEGIINES